MTHPLRDQVARRFAGRAITLADITTAFGVNETVARAVIADLKALKVAKSSPKKPKPTSWSISPPVCFDAILLGAGEQQEVQG